MCVGVCVGLGVQKCHHTCILIWKPIFFKEYISDIFHVIIYFSFQNIFYKEIICYPVKISNNVERYAQ